jgi:hypothetical protein
MPATLTQVVQQFQQDGIAHLKPHAILKACEVFKRLLRATGNALPQEPLDEHSGLGHRCFWIDGSSFSMSDTPERQDHFGQPGGQQPGCGFSVVHLMALFHAGTGIVLRMLSAPLRTHDLSQAVKRHPSLRAGDVMVGDRGVCS